MAFVVVYDANVLFPQSLCDLLIRLARTGLYQAKWTDQILEEMVTALAKRLPDVPMEKWVRRRSLMVTAIRDCLVQGYEPLIAGLTLPDPDDRHVLAAAIRAQAQVIVTDNVKDFPDGALRPFGVKAISADDFVSDVIDLAGETVAAVVAEMAADNRRPPRTVPDVLGALGNAGLRRSALQLRVLLSD